MALQGLGNSEDAWTAFVRVLPDLPTADREFVLDASALLSESERRLVAGLGEEAKTAWFGQFWDRVEATTGAAEEFVRAEHLARNSYVFLRSGTVPTDAGEVWVRFGRPLAVRTVQGADGASIEFWDYGRGPDITFQRMEGVPGASLTAEGRAYLSQLISTIPYSLVEEGTGFSVAGG
jgi:hypothetical protein